MEREDLIICEVNEYNSSLGNAFANSNISIATLYES